MNVLKIAAIFLLFPMSAHAQDQKLDNTVFFASGSDTEDLVVLTQNGFCHGKDSPQKGQIAIYETGPKKSELFGTYADCVKAGGKLTTAIKKKMEKGQIDENLLAVGEEKAKSEKKEDDQNSFAGINWGVGLALTHFSGDIVETVTINDKVISVDFARSDKALVMLESHYFYTDFCMFGSTSDWLCWDKDSGIGPFVTIGVTGEDGVDPLETYGVGIMFGERIKGSKKSWNWGIGWFKDTKVAALKAGFVNGGMTEETDPSKLLEERDRTGVMLIFSSSW